MKSKYYIEQNGKAEVSTAQERDSFCDQLSNKFVAESVLPDRRCIYTTFLGENQSYSDKDTPLIYKTAVFTSQLNTRQEAAEWYSTREDALIGHARMAAEWTTRAPK